MTTCRIPMLQRWSPENHLFGLKIDSGMVRIDEPLFSCCGATGIQVDPDHPKDARMCALRRRWNLVYRILGQIPAGSEWNRLPGAAQFLLSSAKDSARLVSGPRGRVVQFEGKPDTRGLVYSQGVTLSWHYGVVALLCRLDDTTLPAQAWLEVTEKFPKERTVMLVQASPEMWNPQAVNLMEAAVAFAYERSIPLWIFEPVSRVVPVESSKKFKGALQQRISQQKSRTTISWLSPQAVSRLSEICEFSVSAFNPAEIPDIV